MMATKPTAREIGARELGLYKREGETMGNQECESCAEAGDHGVPGVGYSKNKNWSGYWLCQECINEYDSRMPETPFTPDEG